MDRYRITYIILTVITALLLLTLCGCGISKLDQTKLSDINYETVDYIYLSDTLRTIYDSNKDSNKRVSFSDDQFTYLFICYGPQPTSGYTIEIKELYETADSIICDTTLMGPKNSTTTENEISYPVIVLKIKSTNKLIIYK